ncbi:TonB-dependent receptor [Flavilitoribacter nigricans]|uniref:TonB-dependent receptor n=1 Tax=Flavilitoribacter nigricans (strain ATCC 23147 / DSM 23189 / NBRC 102662 / NCIMB 1420 / SS-2) TaxID=1122177 RepID=A0A2D0N0E2_FLAN2|nr:TonB-dependent receptor [Flavilitoribacter nigricans]PHN01955.1 TonB-dependent receptor [Flavilitoribacter nigricans DSM 23189 = NBRC 102662]
MLFIGLLFCSFQVSAQTYSISGIVQSAQDGTTFPAATVMLLHPKDSATVKGAVTDFEGVFEINGIAPGNYVLKVQYVGYQSFSQPIAVEKQNLSLGPLSLEEETTWLGEVTIATRRSTGTQTGDTTQFNAAAFKTMRDASAQSLVEKLPGVTLQDGTIQAQGENVAQILVDGKPFFGNDVKSALQNLPAEVIESVQIYDQKSDKAEMSGFDDGERQKTINIITKANRRSGQFGKMSAGYGSRGRYLLGASVNFFNEDKRVTVMGLSNNINALDYSADANSQGESRTQDGIINTNTLGVNFSDNWGDKVELTGSYTFSQRENEGRSIRIRDYILPSSEGQLYRENSNNIQRNQDHRFNMRLEYNPDKNNRLLFRPYASMKNDKDQSYFFGRTTVGGDPLNQTENNRTADNDDYDIGGSIFFSHRFPKKGRSLTVGGNSGYHANQDESNRLAENNFYGENQRQEILNQYTTRDRTGFNWETNVSYTEPIGKRGQVELEYEIGNNLNDSDKITYDVLDEQDPTEIRLLPDTALSNTFTSDYLSQEVEIGYQYRVEKFRLQVEAEYRRADLTNDQEFPQPFYIERTFENLAPTVRMDFQFSKTKRLDIDYDTRNNAPNIGQLQDVIDITNPLRLRTGNPDLDQAFTNRLRARYRSRNTETDQSFFVYLSSSITDNYIANSSFIATETIELDEGVVLEEGSQLSRPVNLDGFWDFRSYVNYGQPLDFIKSNGNIFGSVNYSHRPGMINEEINFVDNTNFRVGFSISSNISENIDFNFSTRSSYNVVENSLRPSLNNNYFYQSTRLSYDWIIFKDIVYRLDVNHRYNSGLAEDLDRSFVLLNMSLGTKILKNDRGELSLNVYDLFKQNNNIRRNVTELYVEDMQSNVLQRYFMLTFSYNLRHFNTGTTMDDYRELHNDGGGRDRRRRQ